jgi:DivIVA domain-containing protein
VDERERDRAEESVGESPAVAVPSFPSASAPRAAADQIRDVSFHTAVRGYDRHEVDRYVQRVNRTIAELEIASSPQSAVRHALDRVGEQTSGILQRARETADEIVRTAGSEADETIARGKAEAEEIIADARARADQLMTEAEADGRARVEHAERERAALVEQSEEALAAATAHTARAKSEAEEIVAKATKEAEQILARADAQAVELRAREEQRLEELRLNAEDEIGALRAEIDSIEAERGRMLDEVHEVAERLEEIVDASRPSAEPEQAPSTEAGLAEPSGAPDALEQESSGNRNSGAADLAWAEAADDARRPDGVVQEAPPAP